MVLSPLQSHAQAIALCLTLKSETNLVGFVVVQLLSRVRLFPTPWMAAHQASRSVTISWSLLKIMSMGTGDAIQPSHLKECIHLYVSVNHFTAQTETNTI